MSSTTIRNSHIELYAIYLPTEFVRANEIQIGIKYDIKIEGLESPDATGTMTQSYMLGGLSKLYRFYSLEDGDQISIDFQDDVIIIEPPKNKIKGGAPSPAVEPSDGAASNQADGSVTPTVFERKKLKHIHIPEFAPANLHGCNPETETDVFLVFGRLSENTDYRYCCGCSKDLLDKLGYAAKPMGADKPGAKPDAFLIDRATDEYLIAEFKIYSSDFTLNHHAEDVDVLVCWLHDEKDHSKLPERVLALKDLREKSLKAGKIDID
jgi:hypothetical protein